MATALAFPADANQVTTTPRRSSSPPPSFGRPAKIVGREREVVAIERLFEQGVRAVTLVGPPGIGKSAVASLFASRTADPERVLRVELGGARTQDEASEAVARALGLSPLTRGLDEAVHVAIESRRPELVILDDAEHVIGTAAKVSAIVRSASDARVVVTSRLALSSEDEACIEIGPLAVTRSEGAAISPAAAMLLVRAAQWRAPEDWTAAERESIERIAATVDGVPLALETIAGRLRSLDVPSVAAWFTKPEVLLAEKSGAADGHVSVDTALAWSWDLLDDAERADLVALATFEGAFDLEAAEAVLAPSARPVLARLMSLRDKHLLQIGGRGESGTIRFSLFSVTRAFVRSRQHELASAEHANARHTEYFLARARSLSLAWVYTLESAGGAHAFADVLSAVDCTLARRDLESPAVLATLLDALPGLAGMAVDAATIPLATSRLERAAAFVTMAPADARARFWLAWGTLRRIAGGPLDAEKCFEAAREAAEDTELALLADVARAAVLIRTGRTRDAEAALERPLAGPESLLRAEALRLSAAARAVDGRTKEAELLAREAFRADVALEITPRPAFVILLCALLAENGRFAEARAHLEAAREGFAQAGRGRWVALCDTNLASSALDEGRLPYAIDHYASAYAAHAAAGDAFEAGLASGYWGVTLLLQGQAALAVDKLRRAVELSERAASHDKARFFRGVLAVATAHERNASATERATAILAYAGESDELALFREAVNVLVAGRDEKPLALRRAGASAARAASLPGGGFVRRIAIRILETTARDEARREDRVLRIAADGAWFEGYKGKVDLTTRISLRRILVALAKASETAPGSLMTAPELIAAGWPGERILPSAARGRLRVAMCTLRKLGLRDYLASNRHGHALQTKIELVSG